MGSGGAEVISAAVPVQHEAPPQHALGQTTSTAPQQAQQNGLLKEEAEPMSVAHAMMLPTALPPGPPVHTVSATSTVSSVSAATTTTAASSSSGATATTAATSGTGTTKGSKSSKGTSSMTQLGETGRENTGRWTCEEHVLFLKGLEMHGKGWKKIAKLIKTRTVVQIRTHAQKYFQKLAKAKKNGHHGDLLGMEGSRFGKRVKFTGKRRGLVYGSYLVGVEATSAAISPALKPYMPPAPGGASAGGADSQPPLSDKEEDIAIEKGLYRFLSPMVMDAHASELDAAAPEVVPPSTPGAGGAAGAGKDADDGDAGSEAGDMACMADDATSSSTAEPLPTLAKVTPELYDRCQVPEWFRKGGDIDELLSDAAEVDWLADNGGDAQRTAEQAAPIVDANILSSTGGGGGGAGGGEAAPTGGDEDKTAASAMMVDPSNGSVSSGAMNGGGAANIAGNGNSNSCTTLASNAGSAAGGEAAAATASNSSTVGAAAAGGGAPAAAAAGAAPAPAPRKRGSNASNGEGGSKSKGAGGGSRGRKNAKSQGAAGGAAKQTAKAGAKASKAAAAAAAAAAVLAVSAEEAVHHDFDEAFGHHGVGPMKEELHEVEVGVEGGHHDLLLDDLSHIVFAEGDGDPGHGPDGYDYLDGAAGGEVGHHEGLLLLDDLDEHGIEF